jgi:hypothetical protein
VGPLRKPKVRLEKADAPSFAPPPRPEDPELLSEQVLEDVYLEVLTAELEKGSARKWRFRGIGSNFSAPIEDPAFMARVARHEVVFGAGDQLRVRVEIVQRRASTGAKIKETRRITKVHEWIKAPEQMRMVEGLGEPVRDEGPRRLGRSDAPAA